VINVSWNDAVDYTEWLSKHLSLNYRLPSEAEWEYAARADTETLRYWTENTEGEIDAACAYANVFDSKNESRIKNTYGGIIWEPFNCDDDFPFTAPVGSSNFEANNWKLHDMLGNVWEWTQDCYSDSYEGAPTDGSARETNAEGDCSLRVLRGGSWDDGPLDVRSSDRFRTAPDNRDNGVGFRLARTF
jgi:formylglycine-generating enzyme required for sulfatase activity